MKDKYIVIPVEELRADQPRLFLHKEATHFDPRNLHVLSWNALSKGCTELRHLPPPTHCIVKDESPRLKLSDRAADFVEQQLCLMEDKIEMEIASMPDKPKPGDHVLRRAREIDELRAEFGLPELMRQVTKYERQSFVASLKISEEG